MAWAPQAKISALIKGEKLQNLKKFWSSSQETLRSFVPGLKKSLSYSRAYTVVRTFVSTLMSARSSSSLITIGDASTGPRSLPRSVSLWSPGEVSAFLKQKGFFDAASAVEGASVLTVSLSQTHHI